MQSSVMCNSVYGVRVNMKEGRPLMASGRRQCDSGPVTFLLIAY